MTDRIPGAPGRCKAVVTGQELQKLQAGEEFAITLRRDDQPIQKGTPYSKASVLPDALAIKLCPGVDDPAPRDAFAALYEQKSDTVRRAIGRRIILRDAAPTPLMGLKAFGKTTRSGTPTPEAPVALESAGEDGRVTVKVMGKNLFNKDAVSIGYIDDADGMHYDKNTKFFASDWMVVGGEYLTITTTQEEGMWGAFYDANKNYIEGVTGYIGNPVRKIPANAKYIRLTVIPDALDCFQVELGATATAFEPYKEPQTLTLPTPNGLSGIPVASGGNYTDADGQQWVCDEVDFTKGVYVRRIAEYSIPSDINFNVADGYLSTAAVIEANPAYRTGALCTHFNNEINSSGSKSCFWIDSTGKGIRCVIAGYTTNEEYRAFFAANDVAIKYALAEPVVTALTDEQLKAYADAALHTYSPTTTITNDAGADMEVTYYTPTTAVQMVHSPADKGKLLSVDEHGCVVLAPNEIGSAKETFAVVVDKEPFEDDYMGGTGYHIGIYSYGLNSNLFGKTLRIKTYAYGQMRCLVNGIDLSAVDHDLEDRVINPDADITKDPQSGVCEFDVYVPASIFGEINILVPFVNNPYTAFEIHEKRGTAWDEIKSLSDKGVIASGGGVEGYWRKWNNGTAECWLPVNNGFIYNTDAIISVTCTLPFELVETYAVFTDITGEKTQENDDPTHVAAAAFLDYFTNGSLMELYVASPYSDWDCVQGYVYMLGRWKYV